MRPRNAIRRAMRDARQLQAIQIAYQTPPALRTPAQARIVELMELARARRARTGNRET